VNKIHLVFCLHNHQPVGNFDHVFEYTYNQAYLPFLDVYERFGNLPMGLHLSGPLWDWLTDHHPECVERIKRLAEQGTLEILGGAYYEPILAMIPESDRAGQIIMMKEFIRKTFNQDAQGFWLAERVWEQEMVSSLADAGMTYTLVDDSHLKNAGLSGDQLNGYYLTEDHGRLISLFGTNEHLRYLIPFKEPDEISGYLWETKERNPGCLLVYGDDGEKFGGWPGTHDWVYTRGWLERFFTMLSENREWIELITPRQALDRINPMGKVYVPDSSYREMMEWALPVETGHVYEHVMHTLQEQPIWHEASVFLRGGFWRNFKFKYPEANQMYARMMEVSEQVGNSGSKAPTEAVKRLYMAQCNCPYWHGVFGGLYLNHLRFETYRNLLRADTLTNEKLRGGKDFITIEQKDFDFDSRKEIALQNLTHRLYIQPHTGGRIYEWDYYPAVTNLLDTLSRRPETYHKTILENSPDQAQGDVHSIHDMWKLKDPAVREYLTYDTYERKSFLDHILTGEITPTGLRRNECSEHGALPDREYSVQTAKKKNELRLSLTHEGAVDIDGIQHELSLVKTLIMPKAGQKLNCEYIITNTGQEELSCSFGMEWNFAMLAGQADDRYYFCDSDENAGPLIAELHRPDVQRFGLVDEWQRIRVLFEFSDSVSLYTFPVETVSQSESAYEKVYQSSVLYPVIPLNLKHGEHKTFSYTINIEPTG